MGALEMNLQEDELLHLVQRWRNVNINIKNFWYNVGNAALETVSKQKPMRVGKITFEYYDNYLFIKLPSGRKLSYFNPMLKRNIYGKDYSYRRPPNRQAALGPLCRFTKEKGGASEQRRV